MHKHFLFSLFLLLSLHASAQWQRVPWPGIDTDVEYLKNTTCFKHINGKFYACAANSLFVSEDNCATWNKIEGISPYFSPISVTESDEGIFLYGTDSSTGFPYTGYVNTDKQGYTWEPSASLPTCNSFVKIGDTHFAISFTGSFTGIETSTNAGANWQPLQPPGSITSNPSRFTWNHDTMYTNFLEDRRVYRSTDQGVSFQLFSPHMIRGFQKGDGWFAGQLMVGSLGSPGNSDTLIYTLDEGATWQKVKLGFLVPGDNVGCYKFNNQLYLQRNGATYTPLYAFNLQTQTYTDTIPDAAPYNFNDQNYQFGGIDGACYYGLNSDTIYSMCDSVRTNLTSPGGGVSLKEMVTWRDSLYLVQSTTTVNHRAFLTTGIDQAPTDLAPVGRLAYFKPSAYAVVNDTVYSVDAMFPNYIAKFHVPSQFKVYEKIIDDGFQLDEVHRTKAHLIARYYDEVFYRRFTDSTWQNFNMWNLQLAANADYMYYISPNDLNFYRLGESGVPEQLNIPGYNTSQDTNPMLAAHDSVFMVFTHNSDYAYNWKTLYLSTNYGQTFTTIDLAQLGTEEMFHFRYLDGKIYVSRYYSGVYAYDPATDTWSPYNAGLYEIPNSIASLQGEILVTCPNSGLYRRGVQPTYNVRGSVFLDKNANGMWDIGENPVENIGVNAFFAGGVMYTAPDGSYISATDFPVDTHRVLLSHPGMVTVPEQVVTSNGNTTSDFALQIPGNAHDLSTYLFATGTFRPGFDVAVNIRVDNFLTTSSGVKLTMVLPVLDLNVQNTVPAPAYSSAAGDTLVWNLGDLAYFTDTLVTIQLNTNVSTTLGSFIEIEAYAESNETDVQPVNNRAVLQSVVVGSYDPNDKLVSREAIKIQSPPAVENLTYTIRFQNTGTFPTSFVTLYDTLDTQVFDPESIQWLGSSHPFEARLIGGNILKISFPDLSLAPQSESEELSQGFVSFAINTRQPLASPKIIRNRAGIYFDYNAPVITAYAETVVDFVVGTGEVLPASALHVFPNPTSGQLFFEIPNTPDEALDISIFGTDGKLLVQKTLPPSVRSLQLEGLPEGVLWVKVAGKEKEFFGKVVYKK